jgi:hypothetical protein
LAVYVLMRREFCHSACHEHLAKGLVSMQHTTLTAWFPTDQLNVDKRHDPRLRLILTQSDRVVNHRPATRLCPIPFGMFRVVSCLVVDTGLNLYARLCSKWITAHYNKMATGGSTCAYKLLCYVRKIIWKSVGNEICANIMSFSATDKCSRSILLSLVDHKLRNCHLDR